MGSMRIMNSNFGGVKVKLLLLDEAQHALHRVLRNRESVTTPYNVLAAGE
jgi:hypothetical protein